MKDAPLRLRFSRLALIVLGGLVNAAGLTAQSFDIGRSPRSSTKPWAEPDTVPVVLQRPRGNGSPSHVLDVFHNHLLLDIQDDFCGLPPIAAYSFQNDTVFVTVVRSPRAEVCIPEYSGSRYLAAMNLPHGKRSYTIRFSMPTHRNTDTVLTLPGQ